jgi:hypothetical protein
MKTHEEGQLIFKGVREPKLPEPYESGTAKDKTLYEQSDAGKAKYADNMQACNNREAIHAGNMKAEERVSQFNTELENYHINGGEGQTIYPKPVEADMHLEQYYTPARNATDTYYPPTASTPERWEPNPNAKPTDPAPWVLPPDTVLYIHADHAKSDQETAG